MSKQEFAGVYQLDNGYWGYRYAIVINGKRKEKKKVRDEQGNPFKTEKQAFKARTTAIAREQAAATVPAKKKLERKTVQEVYQEYCEKGRSGKAYATIKKQDSLWNNHIKSKFGSRFVDDISVAEIEDYLSQLYYEENRAYMYVESFLKMFYLIFGQAYSRNYLDLDTYNKLCVNPDIKIHMPKMKVDEETDIVSFDAEQLEQLDSYFAGSNAETAYMIGKYSGLRINECYGLKWKDIDFENGVMAVNQQMQYQEGLIKLVSLKTRNAKRKIYMCSKLRNYLYEVHEQQQRDSVELAAQRKQNQIFIEDLDGQMISSLELVNTLPNGKIQTLNSMKYHARTITEKYGFKFKYHYLRHTYGTRLAVLNTPAHLLCNQMGHSSSQITQRYYLSISKDGIQELLKNLENYDSYTAAM